MAKIAAKERIAKAAMAKANNITYNIEGVYEDDRQKFNALAQDFGVTFDANNNVLDNTTKDNVTSNNIHRTTVSGNPHNVTASEVGLGNVDNTSDLDKPISTATQLALDGKQDSFTGYTGDITIVTSVDFVGETVTTQTISVSNGVITGVV